MRRDWLACLTDEIRDEAIENYLRERRLVELQIEEVHDQAQKVRAAVPETGKRLSRLGYWMVDPEMVKRLADLLNIPQPSVWGEYLRERSPKGTCTIHVYAVTNKQKLKKIIREAYRRLYCRMQSYRDLHMDLLNECRAVNSNIDNFQKNHNVLAVLSFVKSLDICNVERSHFLGGNFTAEELTSVEERMRFRSLSLEKLEVPSPLELPEPERIKEPLKDLARDIYRKYPQQVEHMISEADLLSYTF